MAELLKTSLIRPNPVRVRFGEGAADTLPDLLADRPCLLVTSPGQRARGGIDRILERCGSQLVTIEASVAEPPTIASMVEAARRVANQRCEVVVAIGGGSVIDAAKAIVAQLGCREAKLQSSKHQIDEHSVSWLARHLRNGDALPSNYCPPSLIAIPTTAGTGSEVTPWATVWDDTNPRKHSLEHPSLFPEWALVDPLLTRSSPDHVTIACALDALSHAIESLWSIHANPVSTALAGRAVALIPNAIRSITADPQGANARRDLHEASLLAGLASSGTRTGLAHSISYPFTAELRMPHGLACSFSLPEILRFNFEQGGLGVESTNRVVRALGVTRFEDAIDRLDSLFDDIELGRRISRYTRNVTANDPVAAIGSPLITRTRSENNPVPVSESEAREIARHALARLRPWPDRKIDDRDVDSKSSAGSQSSPQWKGVQL